MDSFKSLYQNLPKQVRAAIPGLVILLVLAAALSLDDRSSGSASPDSTSSASTPTASPTAGPSSSETNTFSNLPVVSRSALPPEAVDTLDDIANGGPYDFDKDDSVFQNREGILPDHPVGHYREYTVITPGSHDRGARRIVAGDDGALYYTDDHYSSFWEISQ